MGSIRRRERERKGKIRAETIKLPRYYGPDSAKMDEVSRPRSNTKGKAKKQKNESGPAQEALDATSNKTNNKQQRPVIII